MDRITERTIKYLAKYNCGRGNNLGVWASSPDAGDMTEWVDLKKDISGKLSVGTRLFYFQYDEKYGNNIKIEYYVPSYCEWYTVFEGWVNDDEQLLTLFKMLGI